MRIRMQNEGKRTESIKQLKISLIIFGILSLTSFVPFIQMLLVTVNGGILSLLLNGDKNVILINLINAVISIIILFVCIFNSKKLIFSIIYLFFSFPLFTYLVHFYTSLENYVLMIFICGLLSCLPLMLINFFVLKKIHR
jgi:hypothetical protein